MSERGIIFSAPMVRAILAGAKTETRRLAKFCPAGTTSDGEKLFSGFKLPCHPGDRLWVREAWQTGMGSDGPMISYKATPDYFEINAWDGPDEGIGPSFNYDKCPGATWYTNLSDLISGAEGSWRSPLHMPRWASRITLDVTAVRVERLQDITKEGVIAEGISERDGLPIEGVVAGWHEPYAALWNTLHTKPGTTWDDNPWVVVIQFKRFDAQAKQEAA